MILRRGAVAIYPLTSASANRDISGYANPPAVLIGVKYASGPDNHPQGALSFETRNSYVLIPNNGCLDTKYAITIMFWLYPRGLGSLIHYNPSGRGVELSIESPFNLYARLVPRSGKPVKAVNKAISPRRWSFVTVTYKNDIVSLWINGILVVQHRIGRFRLGLATQYPILIGQKPGVSRKFNGKISCLEIFNYALNGVEITSKMKWCFRSGGYAGRFSFPFLLLYHSFMVRNFPLSQS